MARFREGLVADLDWRFLGYDEWRDCMTAGALVPAAHEVAQWTRRVSPRALRPYRFRRVYEYGMERYLSRWTRAERAAAGEDGWLLLHFQDQRHFRREAQRLEGATLDTLRRIQESPRPFPLWERLFEGQQRAVAHAMRNLQQDRGTLFALETGTGKTVTALAVLLKLAEAIHSEPPLRALVVGPVAGAGVWSRDIAKFDLDLEAMRLTRERVGAVAQAWDACLRPLLVIVSYDHLAARRRPSRVQKWLTAQARYDLCIWDESHYVKNPQANRTRTALRLSRRARWNLCLTATPLTRKPLDLWPQFELLEAGGMGARSDMARRYQGVEAALDMLDHQQATTPQAMLQRDFARFAIRIRKSDMLDLPGEIDSEVHIEMQDYAPLATLYRQVDAALDVWSRMADGLSAEAQADILRQGLGAYQGPALQWQGRRVYLGAVHVFNWMLRCAQLVGGVVPVLKPEYETTPEEELPDEGAHEYLMAPRAPKLRAMQELVRDLPKPAVVITRWKSQAAWLADWSRRQGYVYGEISGQRKDGIDAYGNMTHGLDICGVNIASGSASIDLTRAHHAVYLDVGYQYSHYWQARGRIYRQGQTRKCTHHLLQCPGTVDDHVWRCMRTKQDIVSSIVESRRGGSR